jgi:hypothetical protein
MENTVTKQTSEIDEKVIRVLTKMEEEANYSRILSGLGMATELAQEIRLFIEDPSAALMKMLKSQNEMIAQMFMVVFIDFVNEAKIDKLVDGYAVRVNGSAISLWVFLKEDDYTFENRAKFYEIMSQLANVKIFEKINVDFLVLTKDDLPIPAAFKYARGQIANAG